jgi:hypothetical protein
MVFWLSLSLLFWRSLSFASCLSLEPWSRSIHEAENQQLESQNAVLLFGATSLQVMLAQKKETVLDCSLREEGEYWKRAIGVKVTTVKLTFVSRVMLQDVAI